MSTRDEETLLIVESDPDSRRPLVNFLKTDYKVCGAKSGKEAWAILAKEKIDLVLFDDGVPDIRGVEFFHDARVRYPDVIRILVTESRDLPDIVKIIKEAAVYQVIPKPCPPWHLRLLIDRALESRELARRHRLMSRELKFSDAAFRSHKEHLTKLIRDSYEFDKLVFASDSMLEVCNLARKAAATDMPVLIQGETGTGKELMARAIHGFSNRKRFPFLAQNCGALPDELLQSELFGHKRGAFTGAISDRLGLFVAADGGTVFLDEISEVSPSFQVSLLRFLQEGEVKPLGSEKTRKANVRILAASNRPIKELVEAGTFRKDLYYRLRGFELIIPPLRERVEDIPVLAEYFSRKFSELMNRRVAGITVQVMRHLQAYPFPGNVRELETEIQRMVSLAGNGEFLSTEHLSEDLAKVVPPDARLKEMNLINGAGTLKQKVERLEAQVVTQALLRHRWNQSKVAKELGLSRVGLANKIRRYKLAAAPSGGITHA
ncbi:sigma-54-dependent transcriptional regulator [Nitrospira moscoviensis]|uniref:Hydrogenase transcriptional regulatory protein n=1 Tax=Nitrospira moscoviensis TaxID=42253 RepID=A0A088N9I8_NITMO|nr:sigma-54 dependent transcriptional regulator [Nitrospira moscoviensis]AIN51355.1 hydrogenase transcriptional regulatory protein [Nitrospira moscoviensis]ALA58061.1 Hydrogenase transcriptional regulatory protein HoxA [Nitrospira moscoviensis]